MSRDHEVAVCTQCELRTAWIEARQRVFRTDFCGHCGGQLVSLVNFNYDMKELSRLKSVYARANRRG